MKSDRSPSDRTFCLPRTLASAAAGALVLLAVLGSAFGDSQQMLWLGSFDDIDLTINSPGAVSTGSSTCTLLLLGGNAEISADNTSAALLTNPGGETLQTEYALSFDGDGTSDTGGTDVPYATYDSFLSVPAQVTWVQPDNHVEVTLSVRATAPPDEAPDAGAYSATQTLTVHWLGP